VLAKTVSSRSPRRRASAAVQQQANPVAARRNRKWRRSWRRPQAGWIGQPVSRRSITKRPPSRPARRGRSFAVGVARIYTRCAADVRLRLSERAGDVHIGIAFDGCRADGRLSEGVHDLAASLVNAGYDAQDGRPAKTARAVVASNKKTRPAGSARGRRSGRGGFRNRHAGTNEGVFMSPSIGSNIAPSAADPRAKRRSQTIRWPASRLL